MSGNAARASRTVRLERQIVVLLIQRLRERVERFGGFPTGFGNCSGPSSCPSSDGIGPQIPDELDLVETAAHNDLRAIKRVGPKGATHYINRKSFCQPKIRHLYQSYASCLRTMASSTGRR